MTDNFPQIIKFCIFLIINVYSGWLLLANINMAGRVWSEGVISPAPQHPSSRAFIIVQSVICISLPSPCHCHHNVYPSSFRKSLLSQRKVLLHRGEIRKAESILLKISLTRSICVNILQRIPIFQLSNHNRSGNKLSRMFFSSWFTAF